MRPGGYTVGAPVTSAVIAVQPLGLDVQGLGAAGDEIAVSLTASVAEEAVSAMTPSEGVADITGLPDGASVLQSSWLGGLQRLFCAGSLFDMSFDHAPGNLYMTSIGIKRAGGGVYVVEISKASVGHEPEHELAKVVQAPILLDYVRVSAGIRPLDETRFVLDFGDVIARLAPILGREGDVAKLSALAGKTLRESRYGWDPIKIRQKGGDVVVEIAPDSDVMGSSKIVGERKWLGWLLDQNILGPTFTIDGTRLIDERGIKYLEGGARARYEPGFSVKVRFAEGPARYDPTRYPELIELAGRLEKALRA